VLIQGGFVCTVLSHGNVAQLAAFCGVPPVNWVGDYTGDS